MSEGTCWLCARPLGHRVEWHHPLPKSRGGRETVPVHPICHRTLHVTFANAELARIGTDAERLRAHPALARFLGWISGKSPDFHARTFGASGSTETEESGFSRAFRFDKLNHHKEMAGGSGRYSGIGMSESIH